MESLAPQDSAACMICGYGGHPVNRCPELVAPLRGGFYSGGGGGGGGHGHDDDDERALQLLMKIRLRLIYKSFAQPLHNCFRFLRRSVKNPFEDHCTTNKRRKLRRVFRVLRVQKFGK
jgi:hypothetical protein